MENQAVSMALPTTGGKTIDLLYENGYWKMTSDHGAGQEQQIRQYIAAQTAENADIRYKIAKCQQLIADLKQQQNKLTRSQMSVLNM